MKRKKVRFGRATAVLAAILSFVMMTTCVSAAEISGSAELQDNESSTITWTDSIDEMLDGRRYIEGEVVVVYDNSKPSDSLPARGEDEPEEIGAASGEAAKETFEDLEIPDTENAVSVKIITSETKTTQELLEELAEDPSVVSAEPNYVYAAPEEPTDETAVSIPAAEKDSNISVQEDPSEGLETIQFTGWKKDLIWYQTYEAVSDLSYLQWGYGETDSFGHYSLHSPNWNMPGGTNVDPEKECVVALIDSGIDYSHPDLKPVLVDMTKYGMDIGGIYGYNSTGSGSEDDPYDDRGHGTHCAGIIASS